MDLTEEDICEGLIYKYKITEGNGDVVGSITLPCNVYISFVRYDYEGRYQSHSYNLSFKHPGEKYQNIPKGVYQGILTMKVGETSWFNITKEYLHEISNSEYEGYHF